MQARPCECSIYRYCAATCQVFSAVIENTNYTASFVLPVKGYDDLLVVGLGKMVQYIKWDGKCKIATICRTPYCPDDSERECVCISSVRVSPCGSFVYAGTHNNRKLCSSSANYGLFVFVKGSGVFRNVVKNIKSTTGIAIDKFKNICYTIDPCRYYDVIGYNVCKKTGSLSKYQ